MSVEVIEATEVFRTTQSLKSNNIKARITLFWLGFRNMQEKLENMYFEIRESRNKGIQEEKKSCLEIAIEFQRTFQKTLQSVFWGTIKSLSLFIGVLQFPCVQYVHAKKKDGMKHYYFVVHMRVHMPNACIIHSYNLQNNKMFPQLFW